MIGAGMRGRGGSGWSSPFSSTLLPFTVSEKEITNGVPVLAFLSVKAYNSSSMFSVAPAAVTLHIFFVILVSQEGKARPLEFDCLGWPWTSDLASLGLSFLIYKIGTCLTVMRLLNELSTQYPVCYMVKCSKSYSFQKYLPNAYYLPG